MNSPESKPQGSEQPRLPLILGYEPDSYIAEQFPVTKGHIPLRDWFANLRTLLLPNPSADEEVERLVQKHCGSHYELGSEKASVQANVRGALLEQRQQHTAELAKVRGELADYERSTQVNFDLQKRYNALQGDLATAEMERDEAERVIMATRNMAVEAMNRIRALVGASPNDPKPCETLVSEFIESLRAQLAEAEYHRGRSHELTEGDWVNRVEVLQAELATAQRERDAISDLLDQMIKYAENLGASLRAVRSEPVTGQPGAPY